MSNGYGPEGDGSWKYRLISGFLNWLSNRIGFKYSNASIHDDSYGIGGTEKERIECDTGFLRRLLRDSKGRVFATICAYIYYFTVRIAGRSNFNYKRRL